MEPRWLAHIVPAQETVPRRPEESAHPAWVSAGSSVALHGTLLALVAFYGSNLLPDPTPAGGLQAYLYSESPTAQIASNLSEPSTSAPAPAPTIAPTEPPTPAPTPAATPAPTIATAEVEVDLSEPEPTLEPTPKPTPKPTASSTAVPTLPPSEVPIEAPTPVPSAPPSPPPTVAPTLPPTAPPLASTSSPPNPSTSSQSTNTGQPSTNAAASSQQRPALTAPAVDARYSNSNPAPDYPAMARRLGQEGTVTLEITVGIEGRALQVRVKESSGYESLDAAAVEALRQWRFVPATREGQPVEQSLVTRWTYKLR